MPEYRDDAVLRALPTDTEYAALNTAECEAYAQWLCGAAWRTGRWRMLISHLTALQARAAASEAEAKAAQEAALLQQARDLLLQKPDGQTQILQYAQAILDAKGAGIKLPI